MKVKAAPKIPTHCPNDNRELIGVEYWYGNPERYDGISEYACPDGKDCGYRIGRWTGQVIPRGYCESRLGTRGVVPIKMRKQK